MPQTPSDTFKIEITAENARKFLERLRDDEAFRTKFKETPDTALAEYGINVPEENRPSLAHVPDVERVNDVLRDLKHAPIIFPRPEDNEEAIRASHGFIRYLALTIVANIAAWDEIEMKEEPGHER